MSGVCGKKPETANLQDLLIFVLRGIAELGEKAAAKNLLDKKYGRFVSVGLFATITNANFDNDRFIAYIDEAITLRDELKTVLANAGIPIDSVSEAVTWEPASKDEYATKAEKVGVLSTENEDVRSLRELLIIGLKGVAAYAEHASVLGHEDDSIYSFFMTALASTTKSLSVDEMVAMVMRCGEVSVTTMALLDKANSETYGN